MTQSGVSMSKRLTEYADCAGCASKLAAGELSQVLDGLPEQTDSRILVDYRTADDAGVYRWAAGAVGCTSADGNWAPQVPEPEEDPDHAMTRPKNGRAT